MQKQRERGEPAGGVWPVGGLAADGRTNGRALSDRSYCSTFAPSEQLPSHLVGEEVRFWLESERARGRGDLGAVWQWRRRLLLSQSRRYVGVQP